MVPPVIAFVVPRYSQNEVSIVLVLGDKQRDGELQKYQSVWSSKGLEPDLPCQSQKTLPCRFTQPVN